MKAEIEVRLMLFKKREEMEDIKKTLVKVYNDYEKECKVWGKQDADDGELRSMQTIHNNKFAQIELLEEILGVRV